MIFIVAKYRRNIDVGSFMLQMERVCSLYREVNVKYFYVVMLVLQILKSLTYSFASLRSSWRLYRRHEIWDMALYCGGGAVRDFSKDQVPPSWKTV